jgi:hypothetical protein
MDKDIDKCVNKSDGYAELKKYWFIKTKKYCAMIVTYPTMYNYSMLCLNTEKKIYID